MTNIVNNVLQFFAAVDRSSYKNFFFNILDPVKQVVQCRTPPRVFNRNAFNGDYSIGFCFSVRLRLFVLRRVCVDKLYIKLQQRHLHCYCCVISFLLENPGQKICVEDFFFIIELFELLESLQPTFTTLIPCVCVCVLVCVFLGWLLFGIAADGQQSSVKLTLLGSRFRKRAKTIQK